MKLTKIGDFVLIRTYTAGVHFGILAAKDGKEVTLQNARRLWSWNGALSLSEVASKGIDLKNSKVSESVEEITLLEATEIILIGEKSNLPTNGKRKTTLA